MAKRSTKQQLMLSAISLLLCVSMLVGSTFAWFTDSVTSTNNIIKSGTLDIDFLYADGKEDPTASATVWSEVTDAKQAIFSYEKWEPGYSVVKHIKIQNNGTLALKYQLSIVPKNVDTTKEYKLADVIDVYYADPAVQVADRTDLVDSAKIGTLSNVLASFASTANGKLEAGKEDVVTIGLKMQESAGNEYQGLKFGESFDIVLFATQVENEEDSFDKYYDMNAPIDGKGYGNFEESNVVEISVYDNGTKVGYFKVPSDATVNGTDTVACTIKSITYEGNFTVATGYIAKSFDVSVTDIKDGNTVEIDASIRIDTGIDPTTVKLYHYDTEIPCTYDPNTGYVSFSSTTFSPFTVVYDANSTYIPPEEDEEKLPKASIAYTGEFVGQDIEWAGFGEFSPVEGKEAVLDAAYEFKCTETLEEAKANPYAQWICDFVVSLDRDLGENEIFLAGRYGSYPWIGFHNREFMPEAGEEVALLTSVGARFTYLDIVQDVNRFLCGVGDVDDSLKGATFTVKLRLTDPDNSDNYVDVHTETYKFGTTVVTNGEELQDAINNGEEEIVLGGDIDLSNGGIVIP